MEESKYYIPRIEEFCVGFEIMLQNIENAQWGRYKLKENDNFREVYYENIDFLRVKYLDREDVESLGWRVIQEPYRWQFEYVEGRYKLTTDIYTEKSGFPIPEPNDGQIVIWDKLNDECLFRGYIKNKSELKKIMKQLLILNL